MPDTFEISYISAKNGTRLAGRKYGWDNYDPYPMLCLTDIARNSADFHELALFLASKEGGNRRVLALDYRGHGYSSTDKNTNNYSVNVQAEDVLSFVTALNIGKFDLIASAHGGLIAMLLGGMRAGSLNKIILNDIGPSIDARGLIHIKKLYELLDTCKTLQQAETVLSVYGERHFPSLPKNYWRLEAERLFDVTDNKLSFKVDPYVTRMVRNMNMDERPAEMWSQFKGISKIPLMLIFGNMSDLLTVETIGKMKKLHPHMEVLQVEGQGHAPKLETANIPAKIVGFLNK